METINQKNMGDSTKDTEVEPAVQRVTEEKNIEMCFLRCGAQEQALRTNTIKERIDKQPVSPKCRLCRTKEETVMHLVSGCSKLAKKQYKRRHDNVARRVHWELYKKHGPERLRCRGEWWSRIVLILLSRQTETDFTSAKASAIADCRSELLGLKWTHWYCCSRWLQYSQNRVLENWEISDLAFEVKRIHHVETAILPVVIGALGTVPKWLISTQMTALLGTAGILCRTMNLWTELI